MKENFCFRTDPELRGRIIRWCREQSLSESAGIRELVMIGLGGCNDESAWRAAVSEANMRIWAHLRRRLAPAMTRALDEAQHEAGFAPPIR